MVILPEIPKLAMSARQLPKHPSYHGGHNHAHGYNDPGTARHTASITNSRLRRRDAARASRGALGSDLHTLNLQLIQVGAAGFLEVGRIGHQVRLGQLLGVTGTRQAGLLLL